MKDMMNDIRFCIFILSHGRPDKIPTISLLNRAKYTGEYFIVIDNEDKTADEYYKRYGDRVIMFDKKAVSETFDTADNFDNRKTIVYARNICFDLAEERGFTHFMEMDDDYKSLSTRFNKKGEFVSKEIRNFDSVLERMITFYEKSGIDCLAFAQGGDFIGGSSSPFGKSLFLRRKAMNTLLCSVERRFQFLGRINEDVNTYTRLGNVGKLFMTINLIGITQGQTQANDGGMTDVYLDGGTYLKSFYTIMYCPSSVKISKMGYRKMRIHHKIKWRNTIPCIISEEFKKK